MCYKIICSMRIRYNLNRPQMGSMEQMFTLILCLLMISSETKETVVPKNVLLVSRNKKKRLEWSERYFWVKIDIKFPLKYFGEKNLIAGAGKKSLLWKWEGKCWWTFGPIQLPTMVLVKYCAKADLVVLEYL